MAEHERLTHAASAMRRFWLILPLSLFVACTIDDSVEPVPQEDAEQTLITWRCDQPQACDCPGAEDTASCEIEVSASWRAGAELAAARGLQYDGECFARRLGAVRALGCDTALDRDWDSFEESWECTLCDIFHGDKRLGEACEFSRFDGLEDSDSQDTGPVFGDDCSQGLNCLGGRCINLCEPLGEGEDCSFQSCRPGLVCSYSREAAAEPDEISRCIRPADEGESCATRPCEPGLMCDFESTTCIYAPKAGEPCPMGFCEPGIRCDQDDVNAEQWRCVGGLPVGEACELPWDCETWACENGLCVPAIPLTCGTFVY